MCWLYCLYPMQLMHTQCRELIRAGRFSQQQCNGSVTVSHKPLLPFRRILCLSAVSARIQGPGWIPLHPTAHGLMRRPPPRTEQYLSPQKEAVLHGALDGFLHTATPKPRPPGLLSLVSPHSPHPHGLVLPGHMFPP